MSSPSTRYEVIPGLSCGVGGFGGTVISREEFGPETDADALRVEAAGRAGVPVGYRTAPVVTTFDGALSAGRGVYLFGPVGVGKTRLASGVALAWLDRAAVRFTTSVRLFSEAASTYGTGSTVEDVLRPYMGAGLLVLDDLGKEPTDERTLSRLFDVVNERCANERPTVFTSQFGLPDLAARLCARGDVETARAIVSRLRGWCVFERRDGSDRRLRAVVA